MDPNQTSDWSLNGKINRYSNHTKGKGNRTLIILGTGFLDTDIEQGDYHRFIKDFVEEIKIIDQEFNSKYDSLDVVFINNISKKRNVICKDWTNLYDKEIKPQLNNTINEIINPSIQNNIINILILKTNTFFEITQVEDILHFSFETETENINCNACILPSGGLTQNDLDFMDSIMNAFGGTYYFRSIGHLQPIKTMIKTTVGFEQRWSNFRKIL